jgi:hypothetical protein
MSQNPLKKYFRQPGTYVKLPTKGKWYSKDDVEMTDDKEVAVYPLSAIDDILLNTPDAMLNGQALEKVITNAVPGIKNVKRLMIPDLESIFVGIKAATNANRLDVDRTCPNCKHENTFELNCAALLDASTEISDDDLVIDFDGNLKVSVKPYDFEMRQIFIKKEFEEEKLIRGISADIDDLDKAGILGESVDRLSRITFDLVARSIEKIQIVDSGEIVSDKEHINEWLTGISKAQAGIVIDAVNKINNIGVQKTLIATCISCNHQWEDAVAFDPTSFFGKRS